MAKLEELSELLVSEIKDFEMAVKKLEEIQRLKIPIDSTNLETTIRQYDENLKKDLCSQKRDMEKFSRELEKAKAYFAWALIIFVVFLIVNGVLTYIIIAKIL